MATARRFGVSRSPPTRHRTAAESIWSPAHSIWELQLSPVTRGNPSDISFISNTITTSGYNLIGDNTSVSLVFPAGNPNANNDIVGTNASPINPLLFPLGDYGGTTPTHALSGVSPAIDKGFAFGSTTDQRGLVRPADRLDVPNAPGGDGSDIGAFERQIAPTAASVSIGGRVLMSNGRGLRNAVVVLQASEGIRRTALTSSFDYYRIDDIVVGETYVLSVSSKRYRFAPRVISLMDELTGLDFTPEP